MSASSCGSRATRSWTEVQPPSVTAGGELRGFRQFVAAAATLCMLAGSGSAALVLAADPPADVVVYGATPSGVIAAVTAARAGATTVLLEPTGHVGGMLANGLVATDIGDKRSVGGHAKEFFDRIAARYADRGIVARWAFEPHVAEQVFEEMLADAGVTVVRDAALVAADAVALDATRIVAVTTSAGTFTGEVFIDASYGGDLMAAAGVTHTVGREAAATYGESLAGARPAALVHTAGVPIPEYVATVPAPGAPGTADARIQAFNYRLCFSSDAVTKVPFTEPAGYDRERYLLIADRLGATPDAPLSSVLTVSPTVPNRYDVNSFGPLSMQLPGRSWAWPQAGAAERAAIEQEHADHGRGLVWFLASDEVVPASVRSAMAAYGWCPDEWADNGHFPRQLYIREARRMVAERVLVEQDIAATADSSDAIGIASYRVDAHSVTRWAEGNDILIEGSISKPYTNYPIPFGILLPREDEATNLLVSVAASASHVAWASLRMEPHFMIMGEAAGQAAATAIASGAGLHAMDVTVVQDALRARGVPLPGSSCVARLTVPPFAIAGQRTKVAVMLHDLLGTGCAGTLRLTASDARATLPGDITLTAQDGGRVIVPVTLRTAGTRTLLAADVPTGVVKTSAKVPVQPGPTAAFRLSGMPSSPVAGTSFSMTVTATDAWGNATPGYRGSAVFTTTDRGATLPPATAFDAASETVRVTFRTAGSQAVRATDTTTSTITARATSTVQPGATATFRFGGIPASPVAGTALDVTVRAFDAYGNATPGYRGTVRFSSTDTRAILPPVTSFDASSEVVQVAFRTSGSRTLTATDTTASVIRGTVTAAVQPGVTAGFRWSLPASVGAGFAINATVTAIDAFGNPTPAYRGTARFTSTDRTAQLPPDTTFDAASETARIVFRAAGLQTVRARDTVTSTITGTATANVVR
jgi:hypothetical protein